MGANGNRRQTLRTNIIQPYEAGLLAETDHKDYNAVVGIELDKISTATKHMFQGLDDVRKEVENRTKALDALHLTVNDQFNKVMLEISGVKLQLGQGISVDNVYDENGNPLSGTLEGIQTQINTANANITQALGEITSTNFKFDGEITSIKTDLGVVQQQVGFLYGPEGAQALWTVHQTVQGVTASVGLVTTIPNNKDPINSEFYVKADAFNVYTKDGSGSYQTQPMLSVKSSGVYISDNIYMNGAYITGTLQSANYVWNSSSKVGWLLDATTGNVNLGGTVEIVGTVYSANWDSSGGTQGWRIDKNGNASFQNAIVRGEMHATTGTMDNVTINQNCTILGTVYAENIKGDVYTAQTSAFNPISNKRVDGQYTWEVLKIRGANFDRVLDSNMLINCASTQRQVITLYEGGDGLSDVMIPGYQHDTGNGGASGPAKWLLKGVTLRRVGENNFNYIRLGISETGRATFLDITTPAVFGTAVHLMPADASGNYHVIASETSLRPEDIDNSVHEPPMVMVYKKAPNNIIVSALS